ncbi:MAG: hypothetical protein ACYDA0_05370 [Candidatus Dormibacteraceae bacterium]
MSWVEHPGPETAPTEHGREVLESSLKRNRGQIGMFAALYTFPALSDGMMSVLEQAHFGETELPRVYKEMLATLVSSRNACQY